jgi:hypothetical protein
VTSPARHAGIARSITEADDQFARLRSGSVRVSGRSATAQGHQNRKDNIMIAVALVAWFAVVGLIVIARVDYGPRPLTR